ncbi:MAG: acyloxyacyl hydrolase [Bdellovibrionales bacterium]
MNFVPLLTGVLMAVGIGGGTFVEPNSPIKHRDYISGGIGYFDVFENNEQDSSADLRLEYTWARSLYSAGIVSVHPFVGVEATTDGSFYGLGGIKAEVKWNQMYMTPSFGVGAYYSGDGKNMGSPLQFRTGVEVGYEFDRNGDRVGVQLTHISNADVAETNPGAEIVTLYYHYPVKW